MILFHLFVYWDKLFDAMMKLMDSYCHSKTFQSSKMGALFECWNKNTKDVDSQYTGIPVEINKEAFYRS